MLTSYLAMVKIICLLLFVHMDTIFCHYDASLYEGKRTAYGAIPSKVDIPIIEREWANGNAEAGAELSFALALGAGVDQNLHDAIEQSTSLLSHGAARAYTTLGLLLQHNLTETHLDKDERESKSREYYTIAASLGDPLAQMIAGENYLKSEDCPSAVSYYHKVSSFVIQDAMEMEVSKPNHVRHVWDEDNVIPTEAFPSQDQLDFLEYIASNEPDAALKAASLILSDTSNTDKDLTKAQEYLRKAIEGNSTTAMVWLAQLHLRNIIDGSDFEALKLLEQALEYGDSLAHSGMGRIYMEGRAGKEKNFTKAEYHFKMGIEAGNMDAFYQLGKLYMMQEGLGTSEDAVQLWLLPATLGHVHASWSLAEYYRDNFLESSYRTIFSAYSSTALIPKMCDLVAFLYRTVAQAGEYLNLFDEAFEDYSAGRKEAALMKYLLLSDLGYSAGHINAARILDEGTASIYDSEITSSERAFEMWSRAAKSGSTKGSVRIGDYFYYGLGGKEKNLTVALAYYKEAFSADDPEGGFSVAHATEWGEGTEQNITKAEQIYVDIISKHPDAMVPVTLALLRLGLFNFINETLRINMYQHLTWNIRNIFNNFKETLSNNLSWDYCLILLLVIFIVTSLAYRSR